MGADARISAFLDFIKNNVMFRSDYDKIPQYNEFMDGVLAVSYTHLDVYKRQVIDIVVM